MKNNTGKSINAFIFFCCCIILVGGIVISRYSTGDTSEKNWYSEERLLFYGIPVTVTFYPNNQISGDEIWEYLDVIDKIFNDYNEASEIGIINQRKSDDPVLLSPILTEAITKSRMSCELTNGTFDISIKSLKMLWEEKEKENIPPTREEIKSVLEHCGLDKVVLEDNVLKQIPTEMKFDFGGIIKGIAVDSIVAMLKQNDVTSAMIQLGGETAVFGISPREKPFVIGIQNPNNLSRLWKTVTDQGNGLSISTSGNYRNPIQIGNLEYYHIINPKTGWPVNNSILSVSIVFSGTGNNWLTDSLTTASVVLGPEKAIPIINQLGGEVLFLINDELGFREIKSKGWDSFN